TSLLRHQTLKAAPPPQHTHPAGASNCTKSPTSSSLARQFNSISAIPNIAFDMADLRVASRERPGDERYGIFDHHSGLWLLPHQDVGFRWRPYLVEKKKENRTTLLRPAARTPSLVRTGQLPSSQLSTQRRPLQRGKILEERFYMTITAQQRARIAETLIEIQKA